MLNVNVSRAALEEMVLPDFHTKAVLRGSIPSFLEFDAIVCYHSKPFRKPDSKTFDEDARQRYLMVKLCAHNIHDNRTIRDNFFLDP